MTPSKILCEPDVWNSDLDFNSWTKELKWWLLRLEVLEGTPFEISHLMQSLFPGGGGGVGAARNAGGTKEMICGCFCG